MKQFITSLMLIVIVAIPLWVFSQILKDGEIRIVEPNQFILVTEFIMAAGIACYAIWLLIDSIRRLNE